MPKRKQNTNLLNTNFKESREQRAERRELQRQKLEDVKPQNIEEMEISHADLEETARLYSFVVLQQHNQPKVELDASLLDEFIQFIDASNHRTLSPITSECSAKEDHTPIQNLPLNTPQPSAQDKALSHSCITTNQPILFGEIPNPLLDNIETATSYSIALNDSTHIHAPQQEAKRQKLHETNNTLTEEDKRIFMEFRYTRAPKPVIRYGEFVDSSKETSKKVSTPK